MNVLAKVRDIPAPPPADDEARIEQTLREALERAAADRAPPRLARALEHAVFPGGGRLRPRLVHEVARAARTSEADDALADAAAAAVELLHCASLVHDDLPAFDDAPLRRGRPSVHAAFGEATAVLAGDALIVLAFEVVGRAAARAPARGLAILVELARGVGAPTGIVAGQAWELEAAVPLVQLHRAKTGALFAAATAAGAIAAGAEPSHWREVGQLLGEAYQVADDLADLPADGARQPNLARDAGPRAARARFDRLLEAAVARIPDGPGRQRIVDLARAAAGRLLPASARKVAS